MIEKSPQIPVIMMREMATGGRNLPKIVVEDFILIFEILIELFEEGKQAGIFIDTIPIIIHFMLIGPLLFFKRVELVRAKYAELIEFKELDKYLSFDVTREIEKLVFRAVTV
jgi:hypothetical protein